ncbi:LOW QUALITY PROTEIN: uncharacterized protein [Blastocystis hominis]|uniref:Helicase ATP-binding domain-containing protein n=1 Tax=Blastocystis hominis TaxID=12968 RepID=D8LXP1_BLAHO|nr:LOW QUALITY PROTEIN: uncharacterized protein [Blastocystis hominis]XP_012897846.1 LOW QUALITY PROTEIN: uncharacterized protein [Blastocystis hominis]CBK20346.2 unnamed protein product [Blastocystis hominis]CBK23798.2 unnamed protein product [Blastocystis hominis]|eukprot:XP_012894394.1 LOW QUALITY PROTEIN: uncharacterized protein [Blastocystis hominis]
MNAFGDVGTLISILAKLQTSRILAANTMKSFQGTKEGLPSRLAYNLSDFQQRKDTCPYFFARSCLDDADVIVFNYQYVLDPSISPLILPHINNQNNILLFDEGHNIDDVLCENYSVTIPSSHLKESYSFLTESILSLAFILSKEFQKREAAVNSVSVVKTEFGGKQIIQMPRTEPSSMTKEQATEVEAFIPLLKLMVMAMQNWKQPEIVNGLTINEVRLMIYQECLVDYYELRTFSGRFQRLLSVFESSGYSLAPEK